jgi:hypothetical protein
MLPNAQQKLIFRWLHHHRPKQVQWSHLSTHWCVSLTPRSACRDSSRASATGPLHTLRPCAPLKSGLHYEAQYYRWHSAPAYSMLSSSTSYPATFAHHIGIIVFIAWNPVARIGTVVATVVYSDLLYNETSLVNTMQMEVLISIIKS